MPEMKMVGRSTAARTMAIAMTGPETSSIALKVASLGESPSSMRCSTASTTTIASSTTRPTASTRPKSERVLMEKPNSGKTANVPISETGTASIGISVGAQDDFPELRLRLEAALCANRVSKFLSWRHRQAADAPGGIDRILVVPRADNLRHGDVEGGQLGRLDPEAHGVLARSKNDHLRDAGHASERV